MRYGRASVPTAMVMLALCASPVVGQRLEVVELTGDVVTATTGEPVAGAWIALEGRGFGTYSRRDGRFRLPEVPSAERSFEVAALGFQPSIVTIDPSAGELIIELAPDTSLAPGLTFLLGHLEERRNGARSFDREALAFSGAFDLGELLSNRGLRDVRRFCLDERWAPGLNGEAPEQFYLMQVHGSTARVYTEEFLARMATEEASTVRRVVRPLTPLC
ncbi:MAG: carboxypeptidase-like regulatory domain-containing protein [Longimicrobiales bacterium]